jgi:hypothetical protein
VSSLSCFSFANGLSTIRSHFSIAFASAYSSVPVGPDLRLTWRLSMSVILRILAAKGKD